MEKFEKAKRISGVVFNAIWLAIALFMWVGGLVSFLEMKANSGFGAWLMWGVLCAIPIIIPILRSAFAQGKSGARDGANEYSASVIGNTVYVENHPIRGAILGFIGGLIGGVLIGPVILPIYVIKTVIKLISGIIELKNAA